MLKIFGSSSVKNIDKYTIDNEGISSFNLMERAASAVYDEFIKVVNPSSTIYIFAGTGNNGGDALAVARMLFKAGYDIRTYIVNNEKVLSPDCDRNKKLLEKLTTVSKISNKEDIPFIPSQSIIIDGLFGSGLNRPLEGIYADVVIAINKSHSTVFSIDIPSGLFMENNIKNPGSAIVRASHVYSLQFPKLALLLPESEPYCRNFSIIDIKLSKEAIDNEKTIYYRIEKKNISRILLPRYRFAHKGNFGHVFLIAGSLGKTGAAVLAAKACLRAGAGLLTVHAPLCGLNVLQVAVPEAMVDVDINYEYSSKVEFPLDKITIGIGPGIDTKHDTIQMFTELLSRYQKPMVIDADALNIISSNMRLINTIPQESILTPHPTEFERLIDYKCKNGYERLQYAIKFAKKQNIYIILKGAYTAIVTPIGLVYFNTTGNPGMATGGSGDVLTGILTSLLAQKYTPFNACLVGTYLHGLAGDLAAQQKGGRSMLPTDIIDNLGNAYKILEEQQ